MQVSISRKSSAVSRAIFQLVTAKHGERCHVLYCAEAPSEGDDIACAVEVRVDFSQPDPYSFVPCIYCMGDRSELIDRAEFARRCAVAEEHGDEFTAVEDGSVTVAERGHHSAWRITDRAIAKFRALIALEVFSLPVTF